MSTGVRWAAAAAMILRPVAAEPVKAILSTWASTSAAPVAPKPVTVCSTGRPHTAAKLSANHRPTPGVYSDGLNTTALPAASA